MQLEIFYNLLTALLTVSNMYALVARVQSCANHVQDKERLSHATCDVPSVSRLWLGEVERLICNFYLSVAARKIEQIRPWDTLACCWDVKQPTNK